MNPDDDPEARIRALEQPLADKARASELGSTPYTPPPGDAYVPPPLPPMPPPAQGPPYTPPGYNAPQGFGAPWSPPPRRSSGGIPWVVFVIAAVVFMAIAGAVGFFVMQKTTSSIPSFPGITIPSISVPSMPNIPSEPTTAPPGGNISVAGMGETKTLECNDNSVTVSGVSNTVTITGHCTAVTVSGMQNKVTMDSSDQINASGVNNVITYHSGSPDINNGGANTVEQG
ncbi:MAG TPA: DUF3060 domain-containing protein [Mycobacterium sp.]|nr:DUF3060 domain-containing protein [Mycobacterium sp.]